MGWPDPHGADGQGRQLVLLSENIDREMRRLFEGLAKAKRLRGLDTDAFAKQAAHFLTELNAIHPFREGNGRAQTTFLLILARQAGHPLDLERLHPPAMLNAAITGFGGDEKPLRDLIANLMPPR